MIPQDFLAKLNQELSLTLTSADFSLVGGGCINDALICPHTVPPIFLKHHRSEGQMFATEAEGLRLLSKAAPGFVCVPDVLLTWQDGSAGGLALGYHAPQSQSTQAARLLGEGLAKIHRQTQAQFGLDHDNVIGALRQRNGAHDSWQDFFISERIIPLVKQLPALDLTSKDLDAFQRRIALDVPEEPPALIHGDLWGGNWYVTDQDQPVLIDPAVSFSHREMDLAMTQLFGGFPSQFLEAYQEAFPLEPGFSRRIELHNTYPILVHAVLFGGHYVRQARQMILAAA